MPNRRWAAVAVLVLPLLLPAAPTSAGGVTWHFERDGYRPGELARASTVIGWSHGSRLGTPSQGPYFVYLAPAALDIYPPPLPPEANRVGEVEVEGGGGRGTARIEFEVPDLAPGSYSVLHCNDPCTTPLADITWGLLEVLPQAVTDLTVSRPAGAVPEGPNPAMSGAEKAGDPILPASSELLYAVFLTLWLTAVLAVPAGIAWLVVRAYRKRNEDAEISEELDRLRRRVEHLERTAP